MTATGAGDPSDLERRVARAIYDAASMLGYPGDVDRETAPILARAAIAECFRWQRIETAPKDEMILARRGNLMWVVLWSSDFDEWMVSQTSTVRGLTHWMPRPAALSEDEG